MNSRANLISRAPLGPLTALLLSSAAAQANIALSREPTHNMSCSAGVCTPTARNAVLNVADLTNMLASGDLTIQGGDGIATAAGLEIDNGFSWTSTSRLTLSMGNNIIVDAPVTVAGSGALTLNYGQIKRDDDLLFFGKGKIDFFDLKSKLIINDVRYQLVSNIASLADGVANNPSGAFALANDYDASADGTYTTSPVGTQFGGIFEGLGHSISNLGIRGDHPQTYRLGLFAILSDATVRDFGLPKAHINMAPTGYFNVGVLAGEMDNSKMVACWSSGSVINTDGAAGGLVGFALSSAIQRSHSSADVSRAEFIGGLVGRFFEGGVVQTSYASGSVTAGRRSRSMAGGLVGLNESAHVSDSYATGAVATKVKRENRNVPLAGGLIGADYAKGTANVYSTGTVISSVGYIGGSIGAGSRGTQGYWDLDTSGIDKGCGTNTCFHIIGLTDAELKSGLPDGFDPKIWGQSPNINNGYPYLLANPPLK